MTDFPIFEKDELNSEQRGLWNKLTLGPRGLYTGGPDAKRLPDLYNAWMQFPEFGNAMLVIADAVRAQTELTGKMRELVILTTSALLNTWVEYDFHVPFAKNQGLPDAVISAIGKNETPVFSDEAERIIYEANVQIVRTATLTDAMRDEVVKLIGYRGLMQLIAAISLYVVTAYTSNIAKVELLKDFSADPQKLKDFYAGKSAATGAPTGSR
jgi:alkylhydroperoxidase family enzyme